jgi:L-asparaginase/Glu-tRNA(Gln) amidotransferase subunit D
VGKKSVHVFLTGETIDSYYAGSRDAIVPNKKSVIQNHLSGLHLSTAVNFTNICMKDSRDLTRADVLNFKNSLNAPNARKS